MAKPLPLGSFLDLPQAGCAAVLADLDGCLMAGGTLLPGAAELIAACGARLWIVSNNSTDTAEGLSRRLAGQGAAVDPQHILLAGEETLRTLAAERPGARVALFADPPLVDLAQALGLRPERARPDLAVLARHTGFGFGDLAALAALAQRGVPVRVTNPDRSHPGADGVPVPETGALLAALTAIGPVALQPGAGKPAPDLVRRALARAGVLPGAAVLIGDTEATDGAAAEAAGVAFVLIARPQPAPAPRAVGEAPC